MSAVSSGLSLSQDKDNGKACYMVIMLEFASLSSLDGYRDHIRQYSTRLGRNVGHLSIKLIRKQDGSTLSDFAENQFTGDIPLAGGESNGCR